METKEILVEVVHYIEENIDLKLTIEDIAAEYYISTVHLQRLFTFVFNMPIAEYIRSRKLQKSLEMLYYSESKVCDIAYDIGFGHESSFIRSFKREFGITPSEARKNPHILKITPPICMDDYSSVGNGMMSGIDFVMLPKVSLLGKRYIIPAEDSLELAPEVAKKFWDQDADRIVGRTSKGIYIGYTRTVKGEDYSYYTPSVPVSEKAKVQKGFDAEEIEATLAVRFKYVGHHHYYDINKDIAKAMYEKIDQFIEETPENIVVPYECYFEKIDIGDYDGECCMMEWYTPVLMTEEAEL